MHLVAYDLIFKIVKLTTTHQDLWSTKVLVMSSLLLHEEVILSITVLKQWYSCTCLNCTLFLGLLVSDLINLSRLIQPTEPRALAALLYIPIFQGTLPQTGYLFSLWTAGHGLIGTDCVFIKLSHITRHARSYVHSDIPAEGNHLLQVFPLFRVLVWYPGYSPLKVLLLGYRDLLFEPLSKESNS